MADITRETIFYVAELSRLHIKEEEAQKRLQQFQEIVSYVEKLSGLPTDDIEPTFQVTPRDANMLKPMAEDKPAPSLPTDRAVKNSPAQQDSYFLVPRVIEDGGK